MQLHASEADGETVPVGDREINENKRKYVRGARGRSVVVGELGYGSLISLDATTYAPLLARRKGVYIFTWHAPRRNSICTEKSESAIRCAEHVGAIRICHRRMAAWTCAQVTYECFSHCFCTCLLVKFRLQISSLFSSVVQLFLF